MSTEVVSTEVVIPDETPSVREYVMEKWGPATPEVKGWFPRLRKPIQSYVAPDVTPAEGFAWATEDIVDLRDRSVEARNAVAALKAELGGGIDYDRLATAIVDELDSRKS